MNWLDKLHLRFRPFNKIEELPPQFWYTPRFYLFLRRTIKDENGKFYGDEKILDYFKHCQGIDSRTGRNNLMVEFGKYFNHYIISTDQGKIWKPFGVQTRPGKWRRKK